jgi:lipid-A-disaccharide synthase
MADAMPLNPDRRGARAALGVDQDAPVLAVLPGSRLGEIERLAPVFLQAAALVAERVPGLEVLVPAANAACREALERLLPAPGATAPQLRLLAGSARTAMVASEVVLLASGTATLEAMLAKRPMVVGYRISPTTHAIVKGLGLLKVDRYALPNVLAGETIAPELMQDDCTPSNLADAVLAWFSDPSAVEALEPRYRDLHLQLRRDASHEAAAAVSELLDPVRLAAAGAGTAP